MHRTPDTADTAETASPSRPRSAMPRMIGWAAVALTLASLVASVAPQQLPVSLYKLSLVTMAGVLGYWLDRSLFPYARPDRLFPQAETSGDALPRAIVLASAMLRRAIVVAAAMLATGLGA
jgi:hypothetical protein